jgi:hypothetical protein
VNPLLRPDRFERAASATVVAFDSLIGHGGARKRTGLVGTRQGAPAGVNEISRFRGPMLAAVLDEAEYARFAADLEGVERDLGG